MKCSARKGWLHRCKLPFTIVCYPRRIQSNQLLSWGLCGKLVTTLLILFCFQARAQAFGQGNITLSVKDVPVEQVFKELKKQSGYGFVYPSEVLARLDRVTLSVKKVSLEEVLNQVFKGQPYTYSIIDRVVIIKLRDMAAAKPSGQGAMGGNPIDVAGKVTNEKGEPLPGVTVTVKGSDKITTTDASGAFQISSVDREATLVFSSINMEPFEFKVSGKSELAIRMRAKVRELDDVTVLVNTGYEKVPKERATGSFEFINNEELNRKAGTDILNRLEGISTGILFDRRQSSASQNAIVPSNIMIRGLNTLTSTMTAPLIVLNNFPYEGNINNINPNAVESITILRDAAAASIWGARAGNGVIVITTKQGKYNQAPKLSFATNMQITEKPDIFHNPKVSSAEFIDLEEFLFQKGAYTSDIGNRRDYPALTPAVEIFAKRKAGLISASDSMAQIDALKQIDVRNDFRKYIYRTAVNQQYALSLTGGTAMIKYALSGGFDQNEAALRGDEYKRVTGRLDVTFSPIKNLEINSAITYTNVNSKNNSIGEIGSGAYNYRGSKVLYPYAQFSDGTNHLSIVKDYRNSYTDTAGKGRLLDWKYRPLDELELADNTQKLNDVVIWLSGNYKISPILSASLSYQYENSTGIQRIYRNEQTYYTRSLINLFTQIKDNTVTNIIPIGGILDLDHQRMFSQAGRAQLNINKNWGKIHEVSGIIGAEIRHRRSNSESQRIYGYNDESYSTAKIDYTTRFPFYVGRGSGQISDGVSISQLTDNFVSGFANAAYTYNRRYTISGSIRKDAANLFGVDINDKWKPFWTVGASWKVSEETFFKSNVITYLKLRGSYGYQGNVNNSLSQYTIIGYSSAASSLLNLPAAFIGSPGNPDLSWESLRQINVGLDFSLLKNRISGSIDVYHKKSNNLIWTSPLDLTTGWGSVKKNSAGMSGKGVDIAIQSINLDGHLKWSTEFGFSTITNKVTGKPGSEDDLKAKIGGMGTNGAVISALVGKSPYAVLSLPFAGLDPNTGDPLGYLGKTASSDYIAIFDQTYDTANLIYHGSAIPTMFGYLNNVFKIKQFSFLVNINYRLGYYFRKNTISYYRLTRDGLTHPDYTKRWQAPGDEKHTTIPSLVYPVSNTRRDDFYEQSEVNILKGDNIRLQNIRVAYDFLGNGVKRRIFQNIQVYANLENIGIIWRANKEKLDPDYDLGNTLYPVPRRITLGIKADL